MTRRMIMGKCICLLRVIHPLAKLWFFFGTLELVLILQHKVFDAIKVLGIEVVMLMLDLIISFLVVV